MTALDCTVCVLLADHKKTNGKKHKIVSYSRYADCIDPKLQSFEFQPTVTI